MSASSIDENRGDYNVIKGIMDTEVEVESGDQYNYQDQKSDIYLKNGTETDEEDLSDTLLNESQDENQYDDFEDNNIIHEEEMEEGNSLKNADTSTLTKEFSPQSSELEKGMLTKQKKTITEEVKSVIHENLIEALKSSELLSPVHVTVKNDSYWYHMRKR